MKTYVITLSQTFLAGHPLAGQPTYFIEKFLLGQGHHLDELPSNFRSHLPPKIHTIRGNYDMWHKRIAEVQAGEAVLSVRRWTGKPYNSKQVEIARLTEDSGIGIQRLQFFDGKITVPEVFSNYVELGLGRQLAKNDGPSYEDWCDWFKGYDLTKSMAIIHFTSFRY